MSDFREGVFFDLSESDYHSVEAFSASGAKLLRQSPLDYWARSKWNPLQAEVLAEDASEAKELGSAFDCRIIEGKAAFESRYATKIEPDEYPDCLRTMDEMKAWLKARDMKVSGSKDDLMQRIRDVGEMVSLWDDFLEGHKKLHNGKEFLSPDWMGKIEYAAKMIEADPVFGKAFSGGAPQVSVFWTCPVIGVPCKARFDYLKARAIVDLKTVQPMKGNPHAQTINTAIGRYRYHVQATLYMEAATNVARFLKEGETNAANPEHAENGSVLKALMADHQKTWLWVFQVKGPAPTVIGRTLSPESMICQAARAEIEAMKQLYRLCREKWGTDPWLYDPAKPPKIELLQDSDIPPWALQ